MPYSDDNLFIKKFNKKDQHMIFKQQSQNFLGDNQYSGEFQKTRKNNPFNGRKASSKLGNISMHEDPDTTQLQQNQQSPQAQNRYSNKISQVNTRRENQTLARRENYKSKVQSVIEYENTDQFEKVRGNNMFMQNKGSMLQLKQDPIVKQIRQRPVKMFPKHYFFQKRNDQAVFQQLNAQQLYSYDYSISDLQLVGSQFQSKNPDISSLFQKNRYDKDNIIHTELFSFLKQKYLEQQDFISKDANFVKQNQQGNNSPMKNMAHINTLDVSANMGQGPDNKLIDNSMIFPKTDINRHRKLMSQVGSKNPQGTPAQQKLLKNSRAKNSQISTDTKVQPQVKENNAECNKKQDNLMQEDLQRKTQSNNQRLRPKKTQNANSTQFLLEQQKVQSESEKLERLLKHQKEIKAKYNDISISQKQTVRDEPYKYIVIRGNNSELIKRCLDERNGEWQEIQCSNTLFNFKWIPFSKGIRFDYLTTHGQKKMVNHFQFQDQISQKDTLFLNLQKYCEALKRNVFTMLPITFIIDYSSKHVFTELERFNTYFNILERNKTTNDLCQLNKELANHPLFLNVKYASATKYIINHNMFNGMNFWLIKPTDFNRGRGVQVFSSLEQLRKLMQEYQQGVEIKFESEKQENKKEQQAQPIEKQQSTIPQEQMLANFTNLENVQNIVKTNSFVIQKYLERPLLIKKRKFDIRLWVLVSHDYKCYLFNEGYIRTSSFEFDLSPSSIDKPFIHLTNNAVQKYNESYGLHEEGNQLSFK